MHAQSTLCQLQSRSQVVSTSVMCEAHFGSSRSSITSVQNEGIMRIALSQPQIKSHSFSASTPCSFTVAIACLTLLSMWKRFDNKKVRPKKKRKLTARRQLYNLTCPLRSSSFGSSHIQRQGKIRAHVRHLHRPPKSRLFGAFWYLLHLKMASSWPTIQITFQFRLVSLSAIQKVAPVFPVFGIVPRDRNSWRRLGIECDTQRLKQRYQVPPPPPPPPQPASKRSIRTPDLFPWLNVPHQQHPLSEASAQWDLSSSRKKSRIQEVPNGLDSFGRVSTKMGGFPLGSSKHWTIHLRSTANHCPSPGLQNASTWKLPKETLLGNGCSVGGYVASAVPASPLSSYCPKCWQETAASMPRCFHRLGRS